MSEFDINNELLELCKYFKEKVYIKKNCIEYISALLYLKYDTKLDGSFNILYKNRDNYYIAELIDNELKKLRDIAEYSGLFLNLSFSNIVINRNIGEKNPLKLVIEGIYDLDRKLHIDNDNGKKMIAKAYEYILDECVKNNEIVRENEFYTPSCITDMVASLISKNSSNVFDPFCGSGNFLLSMNKNKKLKTFGNEYNNSIYNICMTNLLLHDIDNRDIFYNEDNLDYNLLKFDAILSNIPFSQKNWSEKVSNEDKKFISNFDLPLKATCDYAYVLSMLNHLSENGTMAVVLPQGVLFRKNEMRVRQKLLPFIEAIIGLPENLFYSTRMEVIILILKKNHHRNGILFIDSSQDFVCSRKCNILLKETQDRIVETFLKRKEISNFSRIVSFQEIKENNFDLMIKKYFRKEVKNNFVKKQSIFDEIMALEEEKNIIEANINDVLKVLNDKNASFKEAWECDDNQSLRKIFGKSLKKFRLEKCYTMDEFAKYLFLPASYYALIEQGKRNISFDFAESICNKLGKNFLDFLS